MLAGGDHDHVSPVVQMIKRVARLRADAVDVALSLEGQQVRLGSGGQIVAVDWKDVSTALRMLLVHQRQRDVEAGPIVADRDARLGQDGPANVQSKIFGVLGPCSRVEIEDDVVLAAVPVHQAVELGLHASHVIGRQAVSVQCVQSQHKQACLTRICRVVPVVDNMNRNYIIQNRSWAVSVSLPGLAYDIDDLPVGGTHGHILIWRVDVHTKAIQAPGEIKAGLHPALAATSCDPGLFTVLLW